MEYNILLMFLPLNQRIFFSEIYENLDFFYLYVDHEEELCCHTKSKLRSWLMIILQLMRGVSYIVFIDDLTTQRTDE